MCKFAFKSDINSVEVFFIIPQPQPTNQPNWTRRGKEQLSKSGCSDLIPRVEKIGLKFLPKEIETLLSIFQNDN